MASAGCVRSRCGRAGRCATARASQSHPAPSARRGRGTGHTGQTRWSAMGLAHVPSVELHPSTVHEATALTGLQSHAPLGTRSYLHRPHGLLVRLLEGPPHGHGLADALHLCRQHRVRPGELLKSEAGNLGDDVVDRGLETRRRLHRSTRRCIYHRGIARGKKKNNNLPA